MRIVGIVGVFAAAGLCTACTTTAEVVRFQPRAEQEAMMRDGRAALVSKGKVALVTIGQVNRTAIPSGRSVFLLTIKNMAKTPQEFRLDRISAVQFDHGAAVRDLRIFSYDELASEERSAQVGRQFLAGMAAGLNSYEASGYGYFARVNAANRNERLMNRVEAEGQRNQAKLEANVIKDHTLMPGETYSGQLHIQTAGDGRETAQNFVVAIMVGNERHDVEVMQSRRQ